MSHNPIEVPLYFFQKGTQRFKSVEAFYSAYYLSTIFYATCIMIAWLMRELFSVSGVLMVVVVLFGFCFSQFTILRATEANMNTPQSAEQVYSGLPLINNLIHLAAIATLVVLTVESFFPHT